MTTELAAPAAQPKTRRYDKIHATYWWEINLNPNWRSGTGEYNRQPVLDGYSKIQGFDEAKDKREVLMGCLVRLRKYVDRCITWEIHRKASTYVDRETDPIILTLTPQNFSAAPSVVGDYQMMHFLNRYYQFLRDGKDVQMLLPKRRASFTKDEYLNIDLQHAHIMGDMHRLNAYVERLSANAHPVGAIISFYNGYKEKYCRSN